MSIHVKEIERVLSLEPFNRYQYFMKKVADSEVMYTLQSNNGELAISYIDGEILLPLWTSIEFAEICKVNEWLYFECKEISLDYFENELIEFIAEVNYLLNVFPISDKTGFVVNLEEFATDLSNELKQYE